MEEEIFVIENGTYSLRLLRTGKDYLITLHGTIRERFGEMTNPDVRATSITYQLKSGDVKELLHALIDLDKL